MSLPNPHWDDRYKTFMLLTCWLPFFNTFLFRLYCVLTKDVVDMPDVIIQYLVWIWWCNLNHHFQRYPFFQIIVEYAHYQRSDRGTVHGKFNVKLMISRLSALQLKQIANQFFWRFQPSKLFLPKKECQFWQKVYSHKYVSMRLLVT